MDNIPTHMNAIVLEYAGAPPSLIKVPVPNPGPNQVLIKVDSSPINPSDLAVLKGTYGSTRTYPAIAGSEGAGIVISEGELQNKRVSFVTGEHPGTYCEYAIANVAMCIPVHDKITLQQASSSFVNPVTVIGMLDVVQKANVTAVVHTAAASQLGRMMVRYFQDNGVKVINVIRRQEQADILKKEGAEYILNQNDADFFEKLTAISTELKATICFDAILGELTGKILSALPNKSTIYVYGRLSGQPGSNISALDLIFKEKTITGFWLTDWLKKSNQLKESLSKVQNMIGTSFKSEIAMEVKILQYDQFSLEQFDEALKFYSVNMTLGKTLIRPFMNQ